MSRISVKWPVDLHPTLKVCHPTNTAGTTWLRESDLVFVKNQAYAVFHWEHRQDGDIPDQYVELDPEKLKHDTRAAEIYRYEGELPDMAQWLRGRI
jgi:hypothetical protein